MNVTINVSIVEKQKELNILLLATVTMSSKFVVNPYWELDEISFF